MLGCIEGPIINNLGSMWRKELQIESPSSQEEGWEEGYSSGEQPVPVLTYQKLSEYHQNLIRLCFLMEDIQKRMMIEGFQSIYTCLKQQSYNNHYHSLAPRNTLVSDNHMGVYPSFGKRSMSEDSSNLNMPKQSINYRVGTKDQGETTLGNEKSSTAQGFTILSKLNNLEKLVSKMRKETRVSTQGSLVYNNYNVQPLRKPYYKREQLYVEPIYHLRKNSSEGQLGFPQRGYTYLPKRVPSKQSPNIRPLRIRTESSAANSQEISTQLREIRKEIQQLISLNKEIINRNTMRTEQTVPFEESQFPFRHDAREKIQPEGMAQVGSLNGYNNLVTYRSMPQDHRGLNFSSENYSYRQGPSQNPRVPEHKKCGYSITCDSHPIN